MDQTSIAFTIGLIFGAPSGALFLRELTGWASWITFPVGAIVGLVLVAAIAYLLIEFSFKLAFGLFLGAPLGALGAVLFDRVTGRMNLLAFIGCVVGGLALFTLLSHAIKVASDEGD